jgi:hypothetical protein
MIGNPGALVSIDKGLFGHQFVTTECQRKTIKLAQMT